MDLSLERGPGINEREFVLALNEIKGERVDYLIPKPAKDIKDIANLKGKVTYIARNNFYNPFRFLLHTTTMVWYYLRLSKYKDYDLLVFRLDIFPLGPFLIAKRKKHLYAIKTLEFFDYFRTQMGFKGSIGRVASPFTGSLYQYLVRNSVAADVCTTDFISYFKKRLNFKEGKLVFIDNAVNTKRFKPIETDEARQKVKLTRFNSIIGFVGGRPLERGGLQMIKCAPLLREKYDNLGLVIVGGSSNEVEQLKEQAVKMGISSQCYFTGSVAYEDVAYYINSFDVGVAFDLADRTVVFGNASQKIRQYIACGKPVVIGEGGNDFIEKEGLGTVVRVDDYQGIADALDYWLSQPYEVKVEHTKKAAAYAHLNLSYDKAVKDRLQIWADRLG